MPRLEVRVCGARQLPNTETFGKIDPYCVITFEGLTYKTETCDDTTSPEWNTLFKFNCRDENSSQLIFRIYNENLVSDEFLGEYCLSISGVNRGEVEDKWVLLSNCKGNAELHIRYCAIDFGDLPEGEKNAASQAVAPPAGQPQPPQGYAQMPPQGYPQQPPQGYAQPPQLTAQPLPHLQHLGFAPPATEFTILSAWFGTDARKIEDPRVLQVVNSLRRGPGHIHVNRVMAPMVGFNVAAGEKPLTNIAVTVGPVHGGIRVDEGLEYDLTLSPYPTGRKLQVVSAWYGVGSNPCWDGIADKLRAAMPNPSTLCIPINKNGLFGDPAPGQEKILWLRTTTDEGMVMDFQLSEATPLTICI